MVSNSVEMPAMESQGGGLLIGSVQTVPEFSTLPSVTARVPEIRFRWGTSEAEMASTRRYHFLFSQEANGEFAFETAGPDDIRTTTLNNRLFRGGELNFTNEYYLHVMAESRSGMLSAPLTIGPVVPRDPTPPVRPDIRARAINANIGFYLTRPALDPETNITYEYSLGTSHHNTSLRSYTTISDWGLALISGAWRGAALGELNWNNNLNPVHTTLPTTGLTNGQQLFIRLRARNSQGTLSAYTSSGPIIFDNTAPPVPSINATLDGSNLTVNMNNLRDPESGIRRVEYRVVNTSTGSTIRNWTNVIDNSTPQMGTFSRSRSITVSSSLNPINIRVYVRVTNGNGLQTVSNVNAVYSIVNPVINPVIIPNLNFTF
jgi:large repetitive protein